MGDFNDPPTSQTVRKVLQAQAPSPEETPASDRLYHLLARKAKGQRAYGSYKYQGQWELIDHLIVSGNLLRPDAGWHTSEAQARIFSAPFLLAKSGPYSDPIPLRTYKGKYYQGGFSDHLPIYTDLLKSY